MILNQVGRKRRGKVRTGESWGRRRDKEVRGDMAEGWMRRVKGGEEERVEYERVGGERV